MLKLPNHREAQILNYHTEWLSVSNWARFIAGQKIQKVNFCHWVRAKYYVQESQNKHCPSKRRAQSVGELLKVLNDVILIQNIIWLYFHLERQHYDTFHAFAIIRCLELINSKWVRDPLDLGSILYFSEPSANKKLVNH